MSAPILATKLYAPPPRPRLVFRPRLIDQLNEVLRSSRKLTLISAPAGFGKTTLVSEWITDCGRPTAWLSLDEGDNDPTRFLTYFVAALQTILPNIGADALRMLQSAQPPLTESLLTILLNEITTSPNNPSTGSGQGFILVLDDYHAIDDKAVGSMIPVHNLNGLSFIFSMLYSIANLG